MRCEICDTYNGVGWARCWNCGEPLDEIEEVDFMEEEWTEVESRLNMWLPEGVGDMLVGEVVAKRDGSYGTQWMIKTEDGEYWTPSHKVLQNRMNEVPIGSTVKIERLADLPPKVRGQNPTMMYRVSIKKVMTE